MDDLGAGGFYEVFLPETLRLNGSGGADTMTAVGNLAALIGQMVFDGGAANDTLLGGNGNDLLLGGEGNDFVDGQQGNDTALLGGGNDVFQWDPGDGGDVVEGQAGADQLLFNGSNGAEIFEASANGSRVRFTRNLANIVMDFDGIETLRVNTFGSADVLNVGDLTGTALRDVLGDLGVVGGGGDGQPDSVTVTGTNGVDNIAVSGSGTTATVTGLWARVQVLNAEVANDSLHVETLAGADVVSSSGLPPGVIQLFVDGVAV